MDQQQQSKHVAIDFNIEADAGHSNLTPSRSEEIQHNSTRSLRGAIIPYLIVSLISCLLLVSLYKLYQVDLTIPLLDIGDATFYEAVVKNFVETGNVNHNALLGAPGQQEMYDFPITHATHFLGFAILRLFTKNYGLIINLYYLLTFPLISITSLFALRRLGVSTGFAIAGGVLFAFLPFHLFRAESHLILSSYYLVPLIVLAALWVTQGHALFRYELPTAKRPLLTTDGILAVVVCALIGMDNPYWAIFSGLFLLVAGVLGRFRFGIARALWSSCILTLVVIVAFGINLLPYTIYASKNGLNPINHRAPAEAEIYGGRVTQLILPVTGHRIPILAKWKAAYNQGAPLVNENDTATLGIIGTVGFFALFAAFYCKPLSNIVESLSVLNLTAVLVFTTGGLGAVFSFLVWSQFRGYNRMSVYIGFFSIAGFFVLADHLLMDKFGRFGRFLRLFAVPVVILGVGLADQIPKHFLPQRSVVEANYRQDQKFVSTVESLAGPGSMIFELPYAAFPGQAPSSTDMSGYDELKGYLHSSSLRWSGGAMIGRKEDLWIRAVSGEPARQMVASVSAAGFAGICIDRYGYADHGKAIEAQLEEILGRRPLVSDNGRRSFFLLDRITRGKEITLPVVSATYGPDVTVSVGNGCGPLERTTQLSWHWCGASGEIVIANDSSQTTSVDLKATLVSGDHKVWDLTATGPDLNRKLQINGTGVSVRLRILAPPGRSIVRLRSTDKSGSLTQAGREGAFRIDNLSSTVTY